MIFRRKKKNQGWYRKRPHLESGSQVHTGTFGPQTPRLNGLAHSTNGVTRDTGLADGPRAVWTLPPHPPAPLEGEPGPPRPPNRPGAAGAAASCLAHGSQVTHVPAKTLLLPSAQPPGCKSSLRPVAAGARGPAKPADG